MARAETGAAGGFGSGRVELKGTMDAHPDSSKTGAVLSRRTLLLSLLGLFSRLWPKSARRGQVAAPSKNVIVFVGDTQSPLFLETLRLHRDRNEEAKAKILERILEEPGLEAVFHLGDVVALGTSEDDWAYFDKILAKFRDRDVPTYVAIGNHEYMSSAARGSANCRKRFPGFNRFWFSVRLPKVGIVALDTNFGKLTDGERTEQTRFYAAEMAALEADPEIKIIVVCTHHPPYTNGRINDPDLDVQKEIVPLFLRSKKALLFLSGHCHAAEHFIQGNKHFLVTGGGGGLLHPLLLPPRQKFEDHFPILTERRWFHYVRATVEEDRVRVIFRMLTKDFSGIDEVDEFVIPWE